MKNSIFWGVMPCCLADVHWCFKGVHLFWNTTELHSRRQHSCIKLTVFPKQNYLFLIFCNTNTYKQHVRCTGRLKWMQWKINTNFPNKIWKINIIFRIFITMPEQWKLNILNTLNIYVNEILHLISNIYINIHNKNSVKSIIQ
jgi:hypothetical protein